MLSFELLNQATISFNNTPLSQFRSQKEAALLIFLAHTQQAHSREYLATLLWESSTTKQSLTNLRTALARLKKQVSGECLIVTRQTVGLAPDKISHVDSSQLFQTLKNLGDVNTAEKATTLQNALASYRGEFLTNFHVAKAAQFNEWVTQTREALRREVISGYSKLSQYALQTGDHDYGLEIANNWLSVDRLDESAQTLRIQLLVETDQTREALSEYVNFTDLLQAELGIEPPENLSNMIQQIQPERTTAPVRNLKPTIRHNLQPEYDQFIGRFEEIEEIHTRLDQPWCHLVSLIGPGGAGKTRLATTIARSRVDQYRDGVWFIELDNLDPEDDDLAETIAVEIAIALDLRLTGADTPIEQVLNHLQHSKMLLILDNFEHVLPGKQLVLDIVQRCDGVQMIVTSREALRLKSEWAVRLGGLTYPSNGREDEPSTAVSLFIARRSQQQWDELEHEELIAVRSICRIVEGLPLAIELAAALTRYDTCQEIAERLTDGFDALKATLDDVPDRHRGMYTVFDMSWQTLSPALQQRLARLAYFRGSFDKTAVSQIADTSSPHLAALAEKSLLTYSRATKRYRLHAIIRAYAEEHRPFKDTTPQKHAEYYLGVLASHTESLQKDKPQESINVLEPDIENIRLAWQFGIDHECLNELSDGLTSLSIYYQLRGLAFEGSEVMQATVQAAISWDEALGLTAKASLEQTRFQNRLGLYKAAIKTAQKTIQFAEQSKDSWAIGMANVWWSESLWRIGESEKAAYKLYQTLDDAESQNYSTVSGWCHHQLAIVHHIQGTLQQGLEHIQKACLIWQNLENVQALVGSLNSMSLIQNGLGNVDDAIVILEEALKYCDQLGDRFRKTHLINNLSLLSTEQEDYDGAIYYLTLGLKLAKEIGNLQMLAGMLINLGRNFYFLEELDSSQKNLEEGLLLAESLNEKTTILLGLVHLSKTKQKMGDRQEAYYLLERALDLSRINTQKSNEFQVLLHLAELLAEQDSAKAQAYLSEAKLLTSKIQDKALIKQAKAIEALLKK